jgi:hypothetical protein
MPNGTYAIVDEQGAHIGTEEFRCAPGLMGWRYVSTIRTSEPSPHTESIDLVVDAGWRPVRLRVETGEHALTLVAEGGRLIGHHDGEDLDLELGDRELDYLSPAFNAVTANRIGETATFDVWYFEPFTLEPVAMRQRYEHRGAERIETEAGAFDATRWGFEALDTRYVSEFWTAGDVVLRYGGLYELEAYEAGASGAPTIA